MALLDLYEKLLPLLQSPPDQPKRRIGFPLKESGRSILTSDRHQQTGSDPALSTVLISSELLFPHHRLARNPPF